MAEPDTIRLNKHLALQLGISRREADELIDKGQVTINNEVAMLGSRFKSGDTISIKGKTVPTGTAFEYILLNKPVGYVCSRSAQGDSPTVYALLPKKYHALKLVGRLDKNSSGLIMLTNDGDFAYKMTHPKFSKTKIYTVRINKDLEPLHQQMISDYGVTLEDGVSKLMLGRLSEADRKVWQVTMSEGRNRQIRRTFESLGYTVQKLHRTNFGNYALGDIKSGKFEIVDMQ